MAKPSSSRRRKAHPPKTNPPKTNAERQRLYRERNGADVTKSVRNVTRVDAIKAGIEPAHEWRAPFLAAFRNSGIVRAACQAAGISRSSVYEHRLSDPVFAEQYREAERDALDMIEAALRQRAVTMDTTAAIYLMKVHGGDEWRRDRQPIDVNVDNRTLTLQLPEGTSIDDLRDLRDSLR